MLTGSPFRTLFPACAILAVAACGGGEAKTNAAAGGSVADNAATAAVEVPDACTFFAKAELESAIGAELRDGEPQSVAGPNESSCRFRRQLGRDAAKSFDNSALPNSFGLTSVTISVSPADPEAVAQVRELDPDAFDDVPGLGDEAYFLGPGLLHVRVGNRGFSVRIEPETQSPDDQAKVREVIIGLGRAGASRL